MSEPIVFVSQTYGQRLTALLVIRSLAIWVGTLIMLGLMVAPALLQGRELSSGTLIGVLVLLVMAQAFQTLALFFWRTPDARRVIWDSAESTFVLDGFRVSSKPLRPGQVRFQWRLPLKDIIEVTLQRGKINALKLKTRQGNLQISSELKDFERLAELMMDLVQNPPERKTAGV